VEVTFLAQEAGTEKWRGAGKGSYNVSDSDGCRPGRAGIGKFLTPLFGRCGERGGDETDDTVG